MASSIIGSFIDTVQGWLGLGGGGDGNTKGVFDVMDSAIGEISSTATGWERDLFATLDSAADNTAYTANNFIGAISSTLQIPLFFGMIFAAIVLIKMIQLFNDPEMIKQLTVLFQEVLKLIRENIPKASIEV